jgi:hypothetical protein
LTYSRDPTYRSLEKVDGASLDMLAVELGKETPGVEVHVTGHYRCTNAHNVLQPNKKHADGRGLLLLHDGFGFLQMQVPETIYNKVQAAKGDPIAQVELVAFVEVEDDPYQKR